MQLYRVTIQADVYADPNWDSIKKQLVIGYQTEDGNIVTAHPGKYEAIKILSVTNDEYNKIEKPSSPPEE